MSLNDCWENYLLYGGFPERLEYSEPKEIYKRINEIYNDMILNDVLYRHKIDNVPNFINLSRFLMNNVSKKISLNKVSKMMENDWKIKISISAIAEYISYLEESLIIKKMDYFSNSTKQLLSNLCRYFCADVGLRNALSKFPEHGKGRVLENILYLHLNNNQYDLYGISLDNVRNENENYKEIDFYVGENNKGLANIQVSGFLNKDNFDFEVGNFLHIKNNNKNICLVPNMEEYYERENVYVFDMIKWLLQSEIKF